MDRANVEDLYPLSPMQQGMLFHALLAPESGVYLEQVSCTLGGDLDADAFERAWREAVARHPVLRTAFLGESLKEPVQIVQRQVALPFRREDWRALGEEEQRARFEAFLEDERRRAFDPARAPLMRLALLRTGEGVHRFVWCYHHVLLDGWSLSLLLGDVFALYDAYRRGEAPRLEPRRPFRDYVAWLRRQDLEKAKAYWTQRLGGVRAATPLPLGAPLDDEAGLRFAEVQEELPEATTSALLALARRERLTPSTLVQGAWALLLARGSGEDDVVFGTTVSGRPPDLPGVESMLGLFINTLPLRVEVPQDEVVTTWLRAVQADAVEARAYEYSPLVQVHGWSGVPRGTPLFESIVVFENYPVSAAVAGLGGGLAVTDLRSDEHTNYPLTLVAGVDRELVLRLLYDTALLDAPGARRVVRHLRTILEGMLANPEGRLRDLSMLGDDERAEVLVRFNATEAPEPAERRAHGLFQEQVQRSPRATALAFGDEELSYTQLDARSNRLAQHLRALGVAPETVVAICLEPSAAMVIAILGVLKAGAAWLPLDPANPPDRLAFMLEDSGARFVVVGAETAGRISTSGVTVVDVERDAAAIEARSRFDPGVAVGPDALAYVIYTSGSTGRPKGVLLHHRGLCNVARAAAALWGVAPEDRVLQFASPSFDASVLDVFASFAAGATIDVVPRRVRESVQELHAFMRARRTNVAGLPPALLAVLPTEGLDGLRVVVSAGDACPSGVAARWSAGRAFFNGYGPTEASVATSFFRVTPEEALASNRIPIGPPLANVRAYVLDPSLRPVPVGVPGELWIGGVGVARGYLNRPELTAERFVLDPFSPTPGARMYRSGDRVRWLEGGALDFLGRLDGQVKVRGFRIELGEIEAALRLVPSVKDAAVAAREDGAGDKRLVAYVVQRGVEAPPAALAEALRARLPSYMVPAAFVSVDALPLNSSGKVDRRALPAPDGAKSHATETYVAPRDAWEAKLVPVWESVLDVRPIGVKDDFFAIGGDSLRAVRVIAQIEQKLGRKLTLAQLFERPTIEHVAAALRLDGEAVASTLVSMNGDGAKRPIYFVHPSGGSVHWYAELARHLAPDQPFYAVQAQGVDGDRPIHTRIDEMAAHYVRAVRERQPSGPYRIGSWSLGVVIAYEMAQQLRAQGERVSLLALVDEGPVLPLEEPLDDAEYLVRTYGAHVQLSVEHLRQLTPDERVAHIWREAKRVNWLLEDVSLESFRHFVRMLKTHTDAWRAYALRPYPGRVTLFRAREREAGGSSAPDLGWAPYALGGVTVRDVPGDHMTMMLAKRQVRALARALQAELDTADAAEASAAGGAVASDGRGT